MNIDEQSVTTFTKNIILMNLVQSRYNIYFFDFVSPVPYSGSGEWVTHTSVYNLSEFKTDI